MLDHFLRLGGNEVVNSARSYGYATTADCVIEWLKDPRCGTIGDAEEDGTYDYAEIADAPWYDPDDAEVTSRFMGLYGIEFAGLSDSTREAEVVQKNGDGAVITGYRHSAREVRVRAWMTARGEDALEAGMTWLRNVLEPNACGQHGGACGESDTAFFVDCPPERRFLPGFTDWSIVRENLCTNPSLETNLTGWSNANSTLTRQTASDPFVGTAYGRATSNVNDGLFGATGDGIVIPAVPDERFTISAYVRGTPGRSARIEASFNGGILLQGSVVILSDVWQRVFLTVAVPAGQASFTPRIMVESPGVVIGSFLEFDGVLIEKTNTLEEYFDGSTVPDDADVELYEWTGTVNNSSSTLSTRMPIEVPESDESYQEYISSYRRFLHSVRCISGPFTVSEAIARDKVHVGRLVEFTLLAGVPWVYGVPREVDFPPTIPTVVQDIAYNMAPYPSAELAGPAVVVSTNYSTNPSLEANATGWAKTQTAPIVTGEVVSGRVTGELAAVGVASYRSVFTASGASGIPGTFSNEQEVALGAGAGARYSINMWSAAVIMAGAPLLGDIIFRAYWRSSAGGTVLRTDELGTVPSNGGALSVDSILPPVGATHVLVRATAQMAEWNAGTIVRLYSDALAVTNP